MKTFDSAFGPPKLPQGASAARPPLVFPFLQRSLPQEIEKYLEQSFPNIMPGWLDDYDDFKPGFLFQNFASGPKCLSILTFDSYSAGYLLPGLACAANIILSNRWNPANNDDYEQEAYEHLPDIFDIVASIRNMTFVSELTDSEPIYCSCLMP